jgi:lysozyme
MAMIPASKPMMPLERATLILRHNKVQHEVALLAVRGYYLRSMGDPTKNDIGIYDDAMFIVSPSAYASFNANTDPSRHKPGIATLLPGLYLYRKGRHGISRGPGYPALRPATPGEKLPVARYGESRVPSARPGVALNIHEGSRNSTSSEGCQTIYPTQYKSFISTVYDQMDRYGQKVIPYLLVEETALRL